MWYNNGDNGYNIEVVEKELSGKLSASVVVGKSENYF